MTMRFRDTCGIERLLRHSSSAEHRFRRQQKRPRGLQLLRSTSLRDKDSAEQDEFNAVRAFAKFFSRREARKSALKQTSNRA